MGGVSPEPPSPPLSTNVLILSIAQTFNILFQFRRRRQNSNHQAMSEEPMSDDEMTQDVTEEHDVTNQPGYSVRLYSSASDHHDNTGDEIEELHDTTPV